jgi:hypothetical protein
MKETQVKMQSTLVFDRRACNEVDLVAIERELRLKQDDLRITLSKLEKAKRVSPEVLKLKISI